MTQKLLEIFRRILTHSYLLFPVVWAVREHVVDFTFIKKNLSWKIPTIVWIEIYQLESSTSNCTMLKWIGKVIQNNLIIWTHDIYTHAEHMYTITYLYINNTHPTEVLLFYSIYLSQTIWSFLKIIPYLTSNMFHIQMMELALRLRTTKEVIRRASYHSWRSFAQMRSSATGVDQWFSRPPLHFRLTQWTGYATSWIASGKSFTRTNQFWVCDCATF